MEAFVAAYVAYSVIFGATCGVIARSRDRDPGGWFLLGVLFGALGLIALVALPPAGRACPSCSERVRYSARKCRHCGEVLAPVELREREPEPQDTRTQEEKARDAKRGLAFVAVAAVFCVAAALAGRLL